MDPADFVQELFDGLNREIQTGVYEVQDWIEAQVHGAAVQLLDSLMPPIVHADRAAVKVSESAIVLPAHTGIGLTSAPRISATRSSPAPSPTRCSAASTS
ncbi:hypothetical protein ABH923_001869 [Leifsonia sp. EB41]|uniref:hypothetical protein n=1 Tax=Leifsonia sp. EB41 TaxID=3156260 RepID=UPI0035142457